MKSQGVYNVGSLHQEVTNEHGTKLRSDSRGSQVIDDDNNRDGNITKCNM